jgi:hypothetical protein
VQQRKARPRIRRQGQQHPSYPSGQKCLLTVHLRRKSTNMGSVKKALPLLINYLAMNTLVQFCDNMQYCCWCKSQSSNEDDALFSNLASICLSDDILVGSHLSPGMPTTTSLLRDRVVNDRVVSHQLSLYSSWCFRHSMHQADTTRSLSLHSGDKEEQPSPYSSTMGSFNLQVPRFGQTTRSRPRLLLR